MTMNDGRLEWQGDPPTMLVVGHDFGWGSAGKLSAILTAARGRIAGLRVVMVGTGLGRSIVGEHLVDEWFDRAPDDADLASFVIRKNVSIAVVVLDPDWGRALEEAGCPVIYVDSIPYIWTDADVLPTEVTAYCAQETPILPEACRGALARIKRLTWVGPIITAPRPAERRPGRAVINLGGLHSPSNPDGNSRYLNLVLPPVLAALDSAGFESAAICGNVQQPDVAGLLPDGSLKVSVRRLSHDAFLDELGKTSLLVTSPGLTTLLEAAHAGTPTICMPPQNLSQIFNGDRFETCVRSGTRIPWPDDVLDRAVLERTRIGGEEAALKMIDDCLAAADLEATHRYLRAAMTRSIQRVPEVTNWDAMTSGQDGRSRNGAEEIADMVVDHLMAASPRAGGRR